ARWTGQIVVSTGDLKARIDRWLAPAADGDAPVASEPAGSVHPRPDLMTAYAAPEGDVQCAIAAVWQTLLGIDRVGAHDDFSELGGHSLLASQAVSRLRKRLGVPLTVKAIFEHPTVAALAESLSGPGPTDALVEQIEGLSEQEVRRLLTEEQG
ncbi:MAG: phosphopantetheine-binding protein, partial [Planctomycetota bacterium]|nr:phosphopantetheine-binding protein [Planctomycetota bacterium]